MSFALDIETVFPTSAPVKFAFDELPETTIGALGAYTAIVEFGELIFML